MPHVFLLEIKYVLISEHKQWSQARQECINLGARLFEVQTQADYNKAIQLRRINRFNYWVGGKTTTTDGAYVWDSNDNPINTEFWHGDTPDNIVGNVCVEWHSDSSGSGLQIRSCTNQRYVCCKYE